MAEEGSKLATGWLELTVSTAGAQKSIVNEIGGTGDTAGRKLGGGLLSAVGKFAAPLAAAVGVGKLISTGFDEVKDAAAGTAQLAAGIKSTGNAANVSVQGMTNLASSIQASTGQTDDSIVSAQSLLLTFTNIKNTGTDKVFDRATASAADMAARMGGDAASKARVLGKALNDPVKGIAQLTRVGVTFTDQQKSQITQMVKAGDTLGAQNVILDEVNKKFGGSAAAFGNTFPGQIARVKRSFEDLSQAAVSGLVPIVGPLLNLLIKGMQSVTPVVQKVADAIGPTFASIGKSLGPLFGQIGSSIGPLIPQFLQLWSSFSPLSLILKAITPILPQLVGAFSKLATTVGGALGSALTVLMPVMQKLSGVLVGALGQALTALLSVVVQVISILGPIFQTVVQAIVPIITTLAGVFGELVQAVVPILTPILGLIPPIAQLVGALLPPLVQLFAAILTPILALIGPLVKLLTPALTLIADVLAVVIGWVVQAITWFVQLVTGNKQAGAQFMAVWNAVMGFFAGIGKFFANIWNGLIDGISGFIGKVVGFFQSIPKTIGDIFAGAGKWLLDVGKNLIQGLIDGATSLLSNIGKFFLSVLPDWIVGPFKLALGINSPSRVFHELGGNIGQGLVEGIGSKQSDVNSAVRGMVNIPNVTSAPQVGIASAMSTTAGGDTFVLNGITTQETARELGAVIASDKRHRIYRTGMALTAGVG